MPSAQAKPRFKSPLSLTLLCALAAALADYLFFDHPLGCNVAIFSAALLMMIAARNPGLALSPAGAALFALNIGLAASLAIEPGPLPIAMSLLGAGMLAMTTQSGWTFELRVWLERWKAFPFPRWARVQAWGRLARRARPGSVAGATLRRAGGAARLWALPLTMGAFFVALFAAANPIIDRWLVLAEERLFRLADFIPELPEPARVLLWIASAWFAWAHLRRKPQSLSVPPPIDNSVLPPAADGLVSAPVLVRCLGVFNAVFLAETSLDLWYLWGGAQLPEGMTMAEYAHRGAYPLLVAALVSAGFVLLTFRAGEREEGLGAARALVYVWLAQNALLAISSIWRLKLYVDAYTLTRWRVAAALWMALVATGLGWIALRIAAGKTNAWLVRANMATTLALLYCCCFVDFDGLIARHNVRHCAEMKGEGPRLDLEYLAGLGVDAIPALDWFAAQEAPYEFIQAEARKVAASLRAELAESTSDWRGETWRRWRIARGQK